MVRVQSMLIGADNSGAKSVKIIGLMASTGKKCASVGDVVKVSVKNAIPNSVVKKGSIYKAVIVRVRAKINRKDGSSISFEDNAAVLLDNNNNPLGTRVFGPVAKEIVKSGFKDIASKAIEVV